MVAIPVFAILVAEWTLNLAGVGEKTNAPLIYEQSNVDVQVFNPEYAGRYFDDFLPSVAFNPFQTNKSDGSVRIVVLGGSTTAGFPYQFYYGFPATMERHLRATNPAGRVEVINLGMTAVNSYTLWDLRHIVVEMDPDLVVIYAGHNEYYGAFGAASSVNPVGNSPGFKRLVLRLKRTALYAGMEQVIGRASSTDVAEHSTNPVADRTLMARVVGTADIELGGDTYQQGVDQFVNNMNDILDTFEDRNIPVLIGTLVSNLSDQAPLGDNASALEAWNAAKSSDCKTRGCNRDLFLQALDMDNIRFRAPSALNEAIWQMSSRPSVEVLDLSSPFDSISTSGIPGYDLFVDHLHPTQAGYELMGRLFAERVSSLLELRTVPTGWPVSATLDPLEVSHSQIQIERLLADYPFVKGRTTEEMAEFYLDQARKYKSGSLMDSIAATLVAPPRPILAGLAEAIELLDATRQSDPPDSDVLRLYESFFNWQPFNEPLMKSVISRSLSFPELDSMTVRLSSFAADRTNDIFFWNSLGAVSLRKESAEIAHFALDRAESLDSNSALMLFNKARLYLSVGDTTSSRVYFQRYQQASQ